MSVGQLLNLMVLPRILLFCHSFYLKCCTTYWFIGEGNCMRYYAWAECVFKDGPM